MYHCFFIHSSVNGHLGCFHVLTIVNSPAMDSGVHVSFSILVSSGYMPSSGIAGSYGGMVLVKHMGADTRKHFVNLKENTVQREIFLFLFLKMNQIVLRDSVTPGLSSQTPNL